MGGHPGQVLPGHLVGQQCSSTVGNTSSNTLDTTSSGEKTSSNTVENTRSGKNTSSITVENTSSSENTSSNTVEKSSSGENSSSSTVENEQAVLYAVMFPSSRKRCKHYLRQIVQTRDTKSCKRSYIGAIFALY